LPTKTVHSVGVSTSEVSGGYRISYAPTETVDNGTYDLILEGSTTMTYTTTLTVTGLQVLTQTQESTPVISNLFFNGTWVNNGDVISPLSTVEGDVTDINPLDINSFIFNIAGHDVTSSEAVWSIIDRGFHFKTVVGPIVPGGTSATYTASTRMANIYGRLGTAEVSVVVNNTTEAGSLIGRVINYPNPYSPARGETTGIRYMLSGNLETKIYIFDITGRLLWQRSFAAGSSGGRAGNNFVVFNGMTDLGTKLTNGLYLVKLTAGGKVLGSAKIVVLN
jgi:hypothetical protein